MKPSVPILPTIWRETFRQAGTQVLKGFWCDDISRQPLQIEQLSKKSVNDMRKILTKAWIGKNGQDEYKMTLYFGKYALRKYARGADMQDCIPSVESMEWIKIDTQDCQIAIWLK